MKATFFRATVALATAVIPACASYPLLVSTDPEDAEVSVDDGVSPPHRVVTPYRIDIDPDLLTTIDVKPSPEEDEHFKPRHVVVNLANYQTLPRVPGSDVRKLDIHLETKREDFVNLTYVDVILDAQRRWRGLITQTRSFKEIAEVGGIVPTRIVTLDPKLGITGLALAPDGNKIVFSLASYAVEVPELMSTLPVDDSRLVDLRGCNLRGVATDVGGIQQISSEDFLDMFPSFTPNGENLLFSSNRRRPALSDLLRISYAGRSAVSNLYINPNEAMALKPTQAVDGTIAFTVYPDNESEPQVWTLGGRFEFPTQITKGREPAISPDGKRIAFIGSDNNLWVTDADGSNQVQLTTSAKHISDAYVASLTPGEQTLFNWSVRRRIRPMSPFSFPSWDATGKYVVYSGMEGNDNTGRPNEDIWMMSYDGGHKQQLTTNGSADRFPLMSPDGKYIYFLSNRGKAWAIWRISTPASD